MSDSYKRIRAVERALAVIEALSIHGSSSLVQLRAKTGLDNATLLRVLWTLIERGWVRQLIVEKKYELSHSLGTFFSSHKHANPMAEIAAPILIELKSNPLELPSDLSTILGEGLIEITESSRLRGPMAPSRTALGLRPSLLRSAHGRAILAAISEQDRDRHIKAYLNRARRDEVAWYQKGKWVEVLAQTREQGYGHREALYWEPPFDDAPEFEAVAIAVQNETGVYGAVSLIWLAKDYNFNDVVQVGLLDKLKQAANDISFRLSKKGVAAPQFDKP
ncbi:MAG: helix-turn-helix domain-containing protein [Candidatus Puniceispirillaceae bacterium]